jgi:hypothetical protein
VFRVSVPERNIFNAVLRAGKVSESGGSDGRIVVEAVLDVFGLPAASFIAAQETGWTPPSREAMIADRRVVRESTYGELAAALDPANLSILETDVGTVATIVGKPSSLSQGYEVHTSPSGTTQTVIGQGAFAPYVITSAAIPAEPGPTIVPFNESVDLGLLVVGMGVQMGAEIGRLDDIDVGEGVGSVTIARGCFDTIPRAHPSGTTVFFISSEVGGDGKEYAASESIDVRILPFTSSSKLVDALAPVDTITIVARQGRPYAPGNVRVNLDPYTDVTPVTGDVAITWSHRDRLVQQDQLVSHDEVSIGPETGTTYTVRVYAGDTSSVVRTEAGIATNTFLYTTAMATTDAVGSNPWFEIEAVRDGLVSFSKYRFGVTLN